jgi:hypothetical protein
MNYTFLYYIQKLKRPTAGGPGVILNTVWKQKLAPNGFPPTTLPEPIKRAREQDIRGFAGEGNVAERNERMRVKRSPTSPELFPGSNRSNRGAWAGC